MQNDSTLSDKSEGQRRFLIMPRTRVLNIGIRKRLSWILVTASLAWVGSLAWYDSCLGRLWIYALSHRMQETGSSSLPRPTIQFFQTVSKKRAITFHKLDQKESMYSFS